MNRSDLTILVTGGTGRQGGAAARHLLADDWKVRALVRDPDSPAARTLAKSGAQLVKGDLLDPASLVRAVAGVHGVYSVQTPSGAGAGDEEREGFNLADAAAAAGVEHFVYSSVYGAEDPDETPFRLPKHKIEAHIAEIGIPATTLRPVTFMENWLGQKERILAGYLHAPVAPDVVRQFIAVDDIGKFVALAFREHGRFVGQLFEIASDEMTMPEVADIFALVLDRPVVYGEVPPFPGMARVHNPAPGEWVPPRADLDSLQELVPDLWTVQSWVRAQDWTIA
ncbi:MAG TPA: NmrA/HSCARG family protein [Coriobacteriia bacterium]